MEEKGLECWLVGGQDTRPVGGMDAIRLNHVDAFTERISGSIHAHQPGPGLHLPAEKKSTKKGQATHIAALQPPTAAAFRP